MNLRPLFVALLLVVGTTAMQSDVHAGTAHDADCLVCALAAPALPPSPDGLTAPHTVPRLIHNAGPHLSLPLTEPVYQPQLARAPPRTP